MAINIAITLFICFSWLLSETNSNQVIKVRLDQKSDFQDLISHSRSIDNILGIMVEFEPDNDIRTSGDGTFQEDLNINFYNSNNLRCEGFIVDPPPHNRAYFESQIKAVNNYYKSVSNNIFPGFNFHVVDDVFSLEKTMVEYSEMAPYENPDLAIGAVFSDGVELAKDSINTVFDSPLWSNENTLIVVFHAGVGEDYGFEYMIDPANYDIRSAYVEEYMINQESWAYQNNILAGILLPETLNLIQYDVIEDIYGSQGDFCDIQIGMTGLFAYLLGFSFGFDELYDTDTGDSGVGVFGLMDVGSFNGRGLIPSPPTPWNRLKNGWVTDSSPIYEETNRISFWDSNSSNPKLISIPLNDNESFLFEAKNNLLAESKDIETLVYENSTESEVAHWFDTLLDYVSITQSQTCDNSSQVTIDDNGVIICFDSYDYGMPGTGGLIWHLNNNNLNTMNNDRYNRTFELIEADGAQDIGFTNYAIFDNPTQGWRWDMWYESNDAYIEANNLDIEFTPFTNPSTNLSNEVNTFVNITNFDNTISGIKFYYNHDFSINNDIIDIVNVSDSEIDVVGAGISNNIGIFFFLEDENLYMYSDGQASISSHNDEYENGDVVLIDEGNNITGVCQNSQYLCGNLNECGGLGCIDKEPSEIYGMRMGYFLSSNELIEMPSDINHEQYAIGDIDDDGLDEIVYIQDGNLHAVNYNGVSCSGFPVQGDFNGNILISDVLNNDSPEIIVRETSHICIISNTGSVYNRLASQASLDDIYLVPNIYNQNNRIGLLDGNRLIIFFQNLDKTYWTNPNGRSSNLEWVNNNSSHYNSQSNLIGIINAYNYPNPIYNSKTTFRYHCNNVNNVKIKIFDVSGSLVDELSRFNIVNNEYNEDIWDCFDFDSGLYFAEIKPNVGASKVVKVLLVK